jgi:choline dehydrogenase-like flavoprotein
MTQRSVDLLCESEDLPIPESRVTVDESDRIHLRWVQTNLKPHEQLVKRTASALRRAGYPLVFTQDLGLTATSHQCGTLRMGHDPSQSVLNASCRAHDVENLWTVDSSVFPSSGAVNPALTVAANALRVAKLGGLVS